MATSPITTTGDSANSAQRFISAGAVSVSKLIDGVGYQANIDPKQISRVEIFDVDIVLFMQGGQRVVIARGALEAQSGTPPVVLTSAGPITLQSLVNQVGLIDTEKIPAPVMASAIVVNANVQDLKREPFAEEPASAKKKDSTNGSADASSASGTVNAQSIDSVSQAIKQGNSSSRALHSEVQQQIAEQSQRTISEQIASPSSPVTLSGVPQVVRGNLDGVKVNIASFNVGGSQQTETAGGLVINGGMGSAQSSTDTSPASQFQPLVIDASSQAGALSINAMGLFSTGVANTYLFQRTVSFQLVGAQSVSNATLTLPTGVKLADGQGTYDAATETWTIDLSRVQSSNSGTVSTISLTLTYDPKGTDNLSGTATLHTEGLYLGTTFVSNENFVIAAKTVTSASDFNPTSEQATVVLPVNTPGTKITGGSGSDTINGSFGNDYIDGGTGANSVTGNGGQDTFVTRNSTDVIKGNGGLGSASDLLIVASAGNFTPATSTPTPDNADIFTLSNSSITGINQASLDASATANGLQGNQNANVLTGNSKSSILWGVLNTTAGADTLVGASGSDTFIVNNGDVINAKGSNNWVYTDSTYVGAGYTLGSNVQNLRLNGSGKMNATGNSQANVIQGNQGNNRVDGVVNDIRLTSEGDTLIGGGGNDTFVLNSEHDVIKHYTTLGDATTPLLDGAEADGKSKTVFIQDLSLMGNEQNAIRLTDAKYTNINNLILNPIAESAASLYGNSQANSLSGNKGNNKIDGVSGSGSDTLIGGGGLDTFIVRSSTDSVNNGGGVAGKDGSVIIAYSNYSLTGTGVNHLKLADDEENTSNTNISAAGTNTGNWLEGNRLNNLITSGNGIDTLEGNGGDDTYIVNNSKDVIIAGSGNNVVQSTVTFTLPTNVNTLELLGGANLNATGNGNGQNKIQGNSGNNVLFAGAGAGASTATTGTSTLVGGGGNDTYILNSGDVIQNTAGSSADSGTVVALGGNANLNFPQGGNLSTLILVDGDFSGAVTGGLSVKGSVSSGTGSANPSTISVVGTGARTNKHILIGNGGNDTFIIQNAADVVTENNAAAKTSEVRINSGLIEIEYTLPNNIRSLVNQGSANAKLYGNGQSGGYSIKAGIGNSTIVDDVNNRKNATANVSLIGGAGNDVFVVNNTADTITSGGGVDEVQTRVNYTLSDVGGVTNLSATPIDDKQANTLSGLALNGNNLSNKITGTHTGGDTLVGNGGNDTFIGGAIDPTKNAYTDSVKDTYIGGAGNDSFVVFNSDTTITGGGGSDSILTYVNYSTGDNSIVSMQAFGGAEIADVAMNLTFTGAGNATLIGNTASNTLTAKGDGNHLIADANINVNLADPAHASTWTDSNFSTSADTMISGGGTDTYVVSHSADRIMDTGGANTVNTFVSFDVNTNFNNSADLTAAGITATNGSKVGNLTLLGNSGTNGRTLTGSVAGGMTVTDSTDGNNTLSDGNGANTLVGGTGSDTYVVGSAGTVIQSHTTTGTETVVLQNSIGTYSFGGANAGNSHLTNLDASQINGALQLTGNTNNNIFTATETSLAASGAAAVVGGGGADTLAITGVTNNSFDISSLISGSGSSATSKLSAVNTLDFSTNGTNEAVSLNGTNIKSLLGGTTGTLNLKLSSGDNLTITDTAANVVHTGSGLTGTYDIYADEAHTTKLATLNVTTA